MDPYRPLELYRLPSDIEAQAGPVGTGWVRSISHGPRTVAEVLAAASRAMDEQDERERQAADPFAWIRPRQVPRRSLFRRLLGRRLRRT